MLHRTLPYVLATGAACAAALPVDGMMERVLQSMAHMHGEAEYDPPTLSSIKACLAGHNLTHFADAGWNGFVEYATNASNRRGDTAAGEVWGKKNGTGSYMEYDVRTMDSGLNVTVYEACNFVSNMAYYRTMISVCDAQTRGTWAFPPDAVHGLVQSYAGLAAGSAFFHAQGSPCGSLGCTLDNLPIGLLSYIAHQAAVSPLPGASPVLRDLQNTSRPLSGVQSAQLFVDMVSGKPVREWNSAIQAPNSAVPDYKLTFAAIVTNVVSLILPEQIGELLLRLVSGALLGPDEVPFLMTQYLPAWRAATAHITLSLSEKFSLALKGIGTLVKIMYAFLWQEEFIQGAFLRSAEDNRLGGEAMPVVNMFANAMTGYVHTDTDMQKGVHVYPGDAACRVGGSPHTKWHEQAGNGLYDLMRLCNDVNLLVAGKRTSSSASDWLGDGWLSFWSRFLPFSA